MSDTCGRKTDGIRCGLPTVKGQSYCPKHKRQYGRNSSKRYGDSMDTAFGKRDRSILDSVWRQHAERIRRYKDVWDFDPAPNDLVLELMLMNV